MPFSDSVPVSSPPERRMFIAVLFNDSFSSSYHVNARDEEDAVYRAGEGYGELITTGVDCYGGQDYAEEM